MPHMFASHSSVVMNVCVSVCVCVCVCVKPCVTSAERVNLRLDDLWPDESQIEVNAAARDDDSYQPPCFLLTDAPLSSASSVLWHRNVTTLQQERYFTHCAAVSLWLEKHYHKKKKCTVGNKKLCRGKRLLL